MLWHTPRSRPTSSRRYVKLFRNGRNQAVRIPRELELPGRDAVLYRDGNKLVLEPLARPSLRLLLASWEPIDTDWPEVAEPAPEPFELVD